MVIHGNMLVHLFLLGVGDEEAFDPRRRRQL